MQILKHIWHNHSRTAGCDPVPRKVSISWSISFTGSAVLLHHPSQCCRDIRTTSFKPVVYFLVCFNNCCWAFSTLRVYFEVEKKYMKENRVLYWTVQKQGQNIHARMRASRVWQSGGSDITQMNHSVCEVVKLVTEYTLFSPLSQQDRIHRWGDKASNNDFFKVSCPFTLNLRGDCFPEHSSSSALHVFGKWKLKANNAMWVGHLAKTIWE